MRYLYLVRHGDAVPESENPHRPLSSRGTEESGKLGRYFRDRTVAADEIWHSTKLRAAGTARIIADLLSLKDKLREKAGICPDDDVPHAASLVEEFFAGGRGNSLIVVSHLPLIPELAAELVSGREKGIPLFLPTAACLCLVRESYGPWMIRWLVEPAMLPD